MGYQTPLVTSARDLLVQVKQLEKAGSRALASVDKDGMEDVLRQCDAIGFVPSLADEMRALVVLPPDQLMRRQLAAAVATGNSKRVVELTVKIKVRA
jgi:hypothetical protein